MRQRRAAFASTDKTFRRLMMIASVVWLGHNLLAGSPAALILEAVFLGSNLVAYYRFYLRQPARYDSR